MNQDIITSLKFQAFKPILAARSPVFNKMFEGGWKESANNSVSIPDFDHIVIQKMVEFCETETIEVTDGVEESLYKIADKYQIQELKVSSSFVSTVVLE